MGEGDEFALDVTEPETVTVEEADSEITALNLANSIEQTSDSETTTIDEEDMNLMFAQDEAHEMELEEVTAVVTEGSESQPVLPASENDNSENSEETSEENTE